ncbi:uncharacterized protein LOC135473760 isoform X2 [Liolophura sinensis]|uniref:uncharacterized protein LOC135473760 isoform X2 n=1 Tax=Liolophura sinensis TaxID=3198878 RepID=UPI0031584F2C
MPQRTAMSDREDNAEGKTLSEGQDPAIVHGACGGGQSSIHASMTSLDQLSEPVVDDFVDNLSLEVQLGEGSSRHASEISSLSYQNLLEDGEPVGGAVGGAGSLGMYSRHESEESVDSCVADYPDTDFQPIDVEKFAAQSYEMARRFPSDRDEAPESTDSTPEDKHAPDFNMGDRTPSATNQLEHSIEGIKLPGAEVGGSDPDEDKSTSCKNGSSCHGQKDSCRTVKSEHLNGDCDNFSLQKEPIRKRNSLEIRNNIPVVGEVKHCEDNGTMANYNAQGAKPKMRKKSPGLACRVNDRHSGSGSDRDGSSSERDVERVRSSLVFSAEGSAIPVEKLRGAQVRDMNGSHILVDGHGVEHGGDVHIENEYDYVKYARVQSDNSYVGMRLAYSSSAEGSAMKIGSHTSSSQDGSSTIGSRESSPEKALHQRILRELGGNCDPEKQNVTEESLTEIPLNNIDGTLGDERQAFTLSPENTECDSIEVESVLSEGEKSVSGMPNVEDGLSSSQTSDVEDNNYHDGPADLLRRRQRAELMQGLEQLENGDSPEGPKDIDAQAIMEDLKAKREALDMAIADIKSAIKNSKGVALSSPPLENELGNGGEPVWVMRDSYVQKLQRQEEMRRVRDEIERQQEEEFAKRDEGRELELDGNKVVTVEGQYRRSNGKEYHTPKGYDTDDEHEDSDDIQYVHRSKGKKYASLPSEDAQIAIDSLKCRGFGSSEYGNMTKSRHKRNSPRHGLGNGHRHSDPVYNNSEVSYNYEPERAYSDGPYSSEECGSDAEQPPPTAYVSQKQEGDYDTDEETDQLLEKQYQKEQSVDIPELTDPPLEKEKRKTRAKEVLIEGVLFRAKYLGSTQLISEGQPSKAMRMMQAQEAVGRIKAPEGESQPSTEVDLFVSTEKIMVLNTDLQEIMMDHALRTISYIADIGDILVIMARRRIIASPDGEPLRRKNQQKILCHVFESEEAQLIAQSIGQAFQVAYLEFLKANGIEDPGIMKEMDYQDVLNQQEIYGEELNLFANKDFHKEVICPKLKSEVLGVVIVESGWGSMVPTVVLANMAPNGAAARCGQLNIGDQIISINGVSLVGLPLSACQNYIKAAKTQTVVKLTVVPCPPVVEVLIKRPDVKYQLGFSVQNGVICSLLRGGIAERGGVRVGHRIIEINNTSVVAVPHDKIVSLLANSVGEIHMKTMPTSIFRLLTGQETPHYL